MKYNLRITILDKTINSSPIVVYISFTLRIQYFYLKYTVLTNPILFIKLPVFCSYRLEIILKCFCLIRLFNLRKTSILISLFQE